MIKTIPVLFLLKVNVERRLLAECYENEAN